MAFSTASGFCVVAALSRYTSGCPNTKVSRMGKSFRTFSTSNTLLSFIVIESCMVDRNMKTDKLVNVRLHLGDPDLLRHVESKSVDQKALCSFFSYASGAEVEPAVFTQLSYIGPMAA